MHELIPPLLTRLKEDGKGDKVTLYIGGVEMIQYSFIERLVDMSYKKLSDIGLHTCPRNTGTVSVTLFHTPRAKVYSLVKRTGANIDTPMSQQDSPTKGVSLYKRFRTLIGLS
jgi:hypothetical protein